MRSKAPQLLPIFRSRSQANLLTILLLHPDRDYTVAELARCLRIPDNTLYREAQRLIEADLISVRQVGQAKLLRVNTNNRVIPPLTQLLAVTFGPHVVLADEFRLISHIDAAFIFGSWAARYEGLMGRTPNDVDVLVVGNPNRADIYEAADRAEQKLTFPVNPVLRTPEQWSAAEDPLVRQIKASHTVPVIGPGACAGTKESSD